MNAKKELKEHVAYTRKTVLAAEIKIGNSFYNDEDEVIRATLYPDHIKLNDPIKALAIEEFLSAIDVEYYNGYGTQELFGTIWYTDGTYSERSEYDGSECWSYRIPPALPQQPKMEVKYD
jgi:hypothetical protein